MTDEFFDDEEDSGRSHASYWLERFGGLNWSKDNNVAKYRDALRTISRTVNITSNANQSAAKGEREIEVRWSDGKKKNTINDDVVYLSPDLVASETRRKGWTDEQVVDVLIGIALTESAFKGVASIDSERKINSWPGPDYDTLAWLGRIFGPTFKYPEVQKKIAGLAPQIWYASEQRAAQNWTLSDFPGFASYFHAVQKYYTSPNMKAEVQHGLDSTDKYPILPNAVAAVLWNFIHPDDPVSLPRKYENPVNEAVARLSACSQAGQDSQSRADATIIILETFAKRFSFDPPPPPDNPDSEKDEGENGEGEDEEGDNSQPENGSNGPDEQNGSSEEDQDGSSDKDSDSAQTIFSEIDLQDFGLHANPGQKVSNETEIEEFLAKQQPVASEAEERKEWECKIFPPDASGYSRRRVEEKKNKDTRYPALRRSVLPLIRALRNNLKLRNEETSFTEKGLRRGDLDEGSLYKLGFIAHGLDDPSVFEQKTVLSKPDVAFTILVDESGSMGGRVRGEFGEATFTTKWELARKSAIVVAEALQSIEGVKLAVLGHTTQSSWGGALLLHHYLTPENQAGISSLAQIQSYNDNLDGYAIERAVLATLRWFPNATTKVVIHVSDGLPQASGISGNNYGGPAAHHHVNRVCKIAAKNGVHVLALGIDSEAMEEKAMNAMYGKNWAVLKDATKLPVILSNLMARVVKESGPKA